MIRLGCSKPNVTRVDGYSDLSYYTPTHYTVEKPFYLSPEFYEKVKEHEKNGEGVLEYNALRSPGNYVRCIAVKGHTSVIEWNWVDAYVKYPLSVTICGIKNILIKSQQKREMKEWYEFLGNSMKRWGNIWQKIDLKYLKND